MEKGNMNLWQRIIAARVKVGGYIQKDKSVSTGGGSYKAVTHDAVTALCRDALNEFGVLSFPFLVSSAARDKEDGAKQFRYEATYDFTFINADDPTQTMVIRIEAHAMDNADKAPGKALSYAKKYAMLKLFEIETGEDEESRYQEPDTTGYLDAIAAAKTMEELAAAVSAAEAATSGTRDKAVKGAIAKLKSEQGKRITESMPLEESRFDKGVAAFRAGKCSMADLTKRPLTARQESIIADLKAEAE